MSLMKTPTSAPMTPTTPAAQPAATATTTAPAGTPGAAPAGAGVSGSAFRPDIPRRVVEIPGTPPRRVTPTGTEGSASTPAEMRKLIVGRDISLSGEIAACDVLVVEGTVEAKLRDGRNIEVADTGLFKGSVEIDEADIGGRFEGDITVRGTLRVRATGRIQGNIRYGTLEVEQGGQLIGSIDTLSGAASRPAAPARAPEPEAEPTANVAE
ncbi:MAG TPA: polymer-forming cytoskeletal protein [Azospirillaceae bacterium]|nr:polymer-forming cytoskeletal protein [Azospirillaceae bacterium]